MVCTKQTFTVAASWNPAQVADMFMNAFIGAGLMTAWHDSFLNGTVENRILKVVYDEDKTYGTTFYWFMFNTAGVYLQLATGWTPTSFGNLGFPVGTQFLDFFVAATNTTNNHWQMFVAATSDPISLVRYTSGDDTRQTFFNLSRIGLSRTFMIMRPGLVIQPWLDLDKGFYSGFHSVQTEVGSGSGAVSIMRGPTLRREIGWGEFLTGANTGYPSFFNSGNTVYRVMGYQGHGRQNQGLTGNIFSVGPYITLPTGSALNNPAYSQDSNPVFHSLPFSHYVSTPLPADFGITFHYASNAFDPGDKFVVDEGTEEWEAIRSTPNTSAPNGPTPIFLARMV